MVEAQEVEALAAPGEANYPGLRRVKPEPRAPPGSSPPPCRALMARSRVAQRTTRSSAYPTGVPSRRPSLVDRSSSRWSATMASSGESGEPTGAGVRLGHHRALEHPCREPRAHELHEQSPVQDGVWLLPGLLGPGRLPTSTISSSAASSPATSSTKSSYADVETTRRQVAEAGIEAAIGRCPPTPATSPPSRSRQPQGTWEDCSSRQGPSRLRSAKGSIAGSDWAAGATRLGPRAHKGGARDRARQAALPTANGAYRLGVSGTSSATAAAIASSAAAGPPATPNGA